MRAKPQVIYHLPPSSNYAATLHSQAKSQSNTLQIDGSMPTSLQISRAAANAAAEQQPQQEAVMSPSPANESRDSSAQQRAIKQPQTQSHRFHGRSHPSAKPRGQGNGNKSHK
jgi:hypothetical protein